MAVELNNFPATETGLSKKPQFAADHTEEAKTVKSTAASSPALSSYNYSSYTKDYASPLEEKYKEIKDRKEYFESIFEALRNGEIPKEMLEELRLNPLDSQINHDTTELITNFIKPFYDSVSEASLKFAGIDFGKHDFDNEPVRFLFSDSKFPNACSVRSTRPHLIIIDKAMFETEVRIEIKDKEGQSTGEFETVPLIENETDLASLIFHELSHAKTRAHFDEDTKNSLFEEGAFYSLPIKFISENGLNPEESVRFFHKLACLEKSETNNKQRVQQQKSLEWSRYLDDHPLPAMTDEIGETTLAAEIHAKGNVTEKENSRALSDEIKSLVSRFEHKSLIEKHISSTNNYEELSVDKKLDALTKIFDSLEKSKDGVYIPVQINDFGKKLLELRQGLLRDDLKDQKLFESVNKLANKVLGAYLDQKENTIADFSGSSNALYSAYLKLCAFHPHKRIGAKPLGTLAVLDKRIRDIRNSKDEDALESACDAFINYMKKEPLLKTSAGRSLASKSLISNLNSSAKDSQETKTHLAQIQESIVEWSYYDKDYLQLSFVLGFDNSATVHESAQAFKDFDLLKTLYLNEKASDGRFYESLIPMSELAFLDNSEKRADDANSRKRTVMDAAEKILNHIVENGCHTEEEIWLLDSLRHRYFNGTDSELTFKDELKDVNLYALLKINEKAILEYHYLPQAEELSSLLEEKLEAREQLDQIRKLFFEPYVGSEDNSNNAIMVNHYLSISPDTFWCTDLTNTSPTNEFARLASDNPIITLTAFLKNCPFTKLLLDDEKNQLASYEVKSSLFNEAISFYPSAESQRILTADTTIKNLDDFVSIFKSYYDVSSLSSASKILKSYRENQEDIFKVSLTNIALFKLLLDPKKKVSLEDYSKILDYNLGELGQEPILRLKMKESFDKGFPKILSSKDFNKSVKILSVFNSKKLVDSRKVDEYLESLFDISKSLESKPEEKLESLKTILAQITIKDPVVKAKYFKVSSDLIVSLYHNDKKKLYEEFNWIVKNIARADQVEFFDLVLTKMNAQVDISEEARENYSNSAITQEDFEHFKNVGPIIQVAFDKNQHENKNAEPIFDFLTKEEDENTLNKVILSTDLAKLYIGQLVANTEGGRYQNPFSGKDIFSNDADLKHDFYIEEFFSNDFKSEDNVHIDKEGYRFLRSLKEELKREFSLLHKNFWAYPVEARTMVIKKLLQNGVDENQSAGENQVIYDKALAKMIPDDTRDAKDIKKLIRSYIQSLHFSQRELALSAMISISPKNQEADFNVGKAVAMFCEIMGPAETMLGQCAESHPSVPDYIRAELKKLKFKANPPLRWEINKQIKDLSHQIADSYTKSLGSTEGVEDLDRHGRVYVKEIGEVLGSGSLYVATEVTMSDGVKQVLSVKRPNALERAKYGFETLGKMVDDLEEGPVRNTLKELVLNSQSKLKEELDCLIADEQYGIANEIYNGTKVLMPDGSEFNFDSAKVSAQGEGFYMMNKLEGDHLAEVIDNKEADPQYVKNLKKSILTFEINNILNGQFCNDRHGGNIKVNGAVGHIDFKAMSLQTWSPKGYDQFAEILVQLMTGEAEINSSDDFIEAFLAKQAEIREREGEVDPFVSEVQKALLSLSEYTRGLDMEDLQQVLMSAVANGVSERANQAIDKQIEHLPEYIKDSVDAMRDPSFLEDPANELTRIQRA